MVIDVEGGEMVSRDAWLQPRHPEPAVAVLLLDPRGVPVPPSAAALLLEWANNDAYTPAGTGELAHLVDMRWARKQTCMFL
jgi:hypothetical protein